MAKKKKVKDELAKYDYLADNLRGTLRVLAICERDRIGNVLTPDSRMKYITDAALRLVGSVVLTDRWNAEAALKGTK
jgi:hypothetical protein